MVTTRRMRWTKFVCVASLLAACSSGRSHIDISPAEVPFTASGSAGTETVAARVEPVEAPAGPLTRALLRRTVSEGIGAFLAGVDLSPMLVRGRFAGFRIDRARGLRRWNAAGLDLRAGDVVTRVNGAAIERPEQAQAAFQALAEAPEIVVEVLREGAPVTVHIPVLSDAVVTAAATSDAGVTAVR